MQLVVGEYNDANPKNCQREATIGPHQSPLSLPKSKPSKRDVP